MPKISSANNSEQKLVPAIILTFSQKVSLKEDGDKIKVLLESEFLREIIKVPNSFLVKGTR